MKKIFIPLLLSFFLLFSVKTIEAVCKTGVFGLGTEIPIGNYRCGTAFDSGLNIRTLYECTSSGFVLAGLSNSNDNCNENMGSNWCVNDGNNAYCACTYDSKNYPPVGYSKNYSTSSHTRDGKTYVCSSEGSAARWRDESGTYEKCINQRGTWVAALSWPRDCPYIEPGTNCIWSSSQKQCILDEPACFCGPASAHCIGVRYANSCGLYYGDPQCFGTKPAVNGGWTSWTSCNATVGSCGAGTQSRSCTNPSPSCGGLSCLRLDGTRGLSESRSCTVSCPTGQNCLNNICRSPVNGACSSPITQYRCNGLIGMDVGSEACVDRGGTCQTNSGSMPPIGQACTLNSGVNGNIQSGYCSGQYSTSHRCCVPNSPLPSGDNAWLCRGVYGGTNASCSCTAGSAGVCGSAAGQSTCSAPTTNLCSGSTGSFTDSAGSDGTFNWTCPGTTGTCGTTGPSTSCSSIHTADVNGGWNAWSTCSGCTQSRNCNSPSPVCSGLQCLRINGTRGLTESRDCGLSNATCGTANGTIVTVRPATNLCVGTTSVTWSADTDSTYNWTCNGLCGGSSSNCSAIRDTPPTFHSFQIRNINNTLVAAESGRNHICQTTFTGTTSPTTARFVVTYSDAQGGSDILNIRLRIGTQIFPYTTISRAGTTAVATFNIPITSVTSRQLESISTSASDNNTYTGSVTAFADTNRDFKYWDCKVPVSGALYDGSTGVSCPNTGYTIRPDPDALNFTSLYFLSGSSTINMTVGGDRISYTTPSSQGLTWGITNYLPIFNSGFAIADPKMRYQASSASLPVCFSNVINTTTVDAYSSNPTFVADFSGILQQDPWWQTQNGGAITNSNIKNRVPVTCATNCQISLIGLVSAPTIDNTGLSLQSVSDFSYSGSSAKLANVNTNYNYFYDQYYVKNGVGTFLSGNKTIADIGTTGIYFINGDLNINANKTISAGQFLMIIVSGNITVQQNVTRVDGILVANNINAPGQNTTALTFNGSLFAFENINFSRSFTDKMFNNLNPVVVVRHNPQLIFTIPGSLAKLLTNWQWGN